MVLENVFLCDLKPNEVYDLKGSWEGRFTKHRLSAGKVMKDLDLKRYIILERTTRTKMLSQLQRDTSFLAQMYVMDYSLLLGVYYVKITYREDGHGDGAQGQDIYGGVRSSMIEGAGIYYFGIIDAIQIYTFRKRLETWLKRWVQRKDVQGISCVEPELYRRRFMKYMRSIMISKERYLGQLNLAENRFGDENVLMYPPRKELLRNMETMRNRKRSVLQRDDMVRISAFDRSLMDNTINSENEEDGVEAMVPHRLQNEFATELAATLETQQVTTNL